MVVLLGVVVVWLSSSSKISDGRGYRTATGVPGVGGSVGAARRTATTALAVVAVIPRSVFEDEEEGRSLPMFRPNPPTPPTTVWPHHHHHHPPSVRPTGSGTGSDPSGTEGLPSHAPPWASRSFGLAPSGWREVRTRSWSHHHLLPHPPPGHSAHPRDEDRSSTSKTIWTRSMIHDDPHPRPTST